VTAVNTPVSLTLAIAVGIFLVIRVTGALVRGICWGFILGQNFIAPPTHPPSVLT